MFPANEALRKNYHGTRNLFRRGTPLADLRLVRVKSGYPTGGTMSKLRALSGALVLTAPTWILSRGWRAAAARGPTARRMGLHSLGRRGRVLGTTTSSSPTAGTARRGDYATPVNPALGLDYRGRRTWLSVGYEGFFLTYRTLGQLNSSEQHARAFFEHRVSPRLTLFAEETFTRAPTTDALELAGVPFYRIGSQTNDAGGGFEVMFTRQTALRTAYTHSAVSFDRDVLLGSDLAGGYAHEASMTLTHMLSPRVTVGGQYDLQHVVQNVGAQNVGLSESLSEGEDRFAIHSAGLTVQYSVTRATRVFALVGASHLGAGLTHEEQTGPMVRAGITRRAELATLSAHYQRSFIPSFGFGGTFQNEEWVGSIHVPFAANRAYAEGGVAWFDNAPLQSGVLSVRSVWVSGTLGYRVSRWLNLEGFYGRSQQDTQRPGGNLTRNQVGFRIVAAKPMRLR